jgi:hypothetical protein
VCVRVCVCVCACMCACVCMMRVCISLQEDDQHVKYRIPVAP